MDRRNRKMDPTERKITKIAREAGKFTVQAMKEEGIGTAEFDFIHLVRHHPGITQTEVREQPILMRKSWKWHRILKHSSQI